MTTLLIGPEERAAIAGLVKLAADNVVDMRTLEEALSRPSGRARHREQMTLQSLVLPKGFLVTFSMESGHPIGRARHLSASLESTRLMMGTAPSLDAMWMIAQAFGFRGSLEECIIWPERFEARGVAVNLVQALEQ